MAPLERIGQALVERRRALGISQAELGSRIGVKRQQIQRWEASAYRKTSLERVARVAEVLGYEPSALEVPVPLAAEAPATYGALSTGVRPVTDLGEVILRIRERVGDLRERYGVTRIAVFGSFARGEQTAASDVDLIVEVERPTRSAIFGAERELCEILGRKADTGPFESLRPRIQPRVAKEMVDVWRA